ncbi:hypothetical protein AALP_AA5G252000 [Arabis alpina]|uniref:Protein kinase domain-containing protein n=1 Tax=Arabis alpina TaxID=50452 RepID=A0A087GZ88_ARAAL|nr:hypothetical protein AALP_AA5G252000 [Arabis alpina]
MEQANDVEIVKTPGEVTTGASRYSSPQVLASMNTPASLSHDGKYIRYNLFGNIFEVTAKYQPPIKPIGKENYGMTEYVVTRWYRAPELLLNSSDYTAAIDVWSVGCVFLEMLNHEPLFPGKDQTHQLLLLMKLIGTPSEDELGSLNEDAKRYIASLPLLPRQSFFEKFPNVPPLAIDLMEKMLIFDPIRRISVEDALAHPYLSKFHDPTDEPVCMTPFNFELEDHPLTKAQLKELIYCEALDFSSEAARTEKEH